MILMFSRFKCQESWEGGKKQKTTSNNMDGSSHSGNECTFGRPEGPGQGQIITETIYVVAKNNDLIDGTSS